MGVHWDAAGAAAFAMLDEHTLATLFYEGKVDKRLDGTPRRPDDRLGIAFYDVRHTYQTHYGSETMGEPENYLPAGSYPVDATQMVMREHSRVALLAGPAGLASLDLDTGCLRSTDAIVPRQNPDATWPLTLAAFDRVHGRIFAITDTSLVRLDAEAMTTAVVPAPKEDIRAIDYLAESDRVLLKTRDGALLPYSAETLAAQRPIALALGGGETTIDEGPWMRPDRDQAMATYYIAPPRCPPEPTDHELRMSVQKACPMPPGTGRQLALIDLASGRELRRADVSNNMRPEGAWSGNGEVFVFDRQFVWHVAESKPVALEHAKQVYSMTLDASGTTYVASDAGYIDRVELATGSLLWQVIVPHAHAAEQP